MISKIWSGLMLKLARLVVWIRTARDATEQEKALREEIEKCQQR